MSIQLYNIFLIILSSLIFWFILEFMFGIQSFSDFVSAQWLRSFKADSHIACRAHAVPLPHRAAKGLECVFPI